MRKFDTIANGIFRTLLEAPVPGAAPAPQAAVGAPPIDTLPQNGGPVPAPAATPTAADRSPTEIKNWETQILDTAKDAVMAVRSNPNILDEQMVKILTTPVTTQNKDQVMDVLTRLSGQS